MKLAALILAKSQSTRLPGKNLRDFHGKPMFLWNVEKCLRAFKDVYVSSDSDHILDIASLVGAKPIKRGLNLCGEVPNIPVYQHALQFMGDVGGVVAVQANSPTLEYNILVLVKRLLDMGVREVMTCHPMEHDKSYHEQNTKIYGSVWGILRHRLEFYADPYRPDPDVLLVDNSVDIETYQDYEKALLQWQLTRQ